PADRHRVAAAGRPASGETDPPTGTSPRRPTRYQDPARRPHRLTPAAITTTSPRSSLSTHRAAQRVRLHHPTGATRTPARKGGVDERRRRCGGSAALRGGGAAVLLVGPVRVQEGRERLGRLVSRDARHGVVI